MSNRNRYPRTVCKYCAEIVHGPDHFGGYVDALNQLYGADGHAHEGDRNQVVLDLDHWVGGKDREKGDGN